MERTADVAQQPLVTVAMPVRNAAETLDAAIKSILNQTHKNWHLIIIDDGSNDATLQIARAYEDDRIRCISDGNRLGLAARLNQIIDMAQGDYLARLDADDIAYPQRLEKQVAFLEKHTEVDLLGSAALLFQDDGSIEGVLDVETSHAALQARRWQGFRIPHPSWLGRTQWFRKYRYDPAMQRAQDQELLLRAVDDSRYACVPEVLIGYRKTQVFLGKRLLGRAYLAQALIAHAIASHRYATIARIIFEQIAKGVFDILMALPVIGKYLKHPAGRPATLEEQSNWIQVAQTVRLQVGAP